MFWFVLFSFWFKIIMSSPYDAIRAVVQETGSDARVEVNQRALIDKILARYASAGAVYRELLQNSNDAEATVAELHFTTTTTNSNTTALTSKTNPGKDGIVQQVLYRNNGVPFRPQDWSRLQKVRANSAFCSFYNGWYSTLGSHSSPTLLPCTR